MATTTTTALQLVIPNAEAQDDDGFVRGYVVPAGTTTEDLPYEALVELDLPATEDEAEWWQNVRNALAGEGYAIEGEIVQDCAEVTATVVAA